MEGTRLANSVGGLCPGTAYRNSLSHVLKAVDQCSRRFLLNQSAAQYSSATNIVVHMVTHKLVTSRMMRGLFGISQHCRGSSKERQACTGLGGGDGEFDGPRCLAVGGWQEHGGVHSAELGQVVDGRRNGRRVARRNVHLHMKTRESCTSHTQRLDPIVPAMLKQTRYARIYANVVEMHQAEMMEGNSSAAHH